VPAICRFERCKLHLVFTDEYISRERLDPRILWITLINRGYLDYTRNFLRSARRSAVPIRLIVYCTDEESLRELEGEDGCVALPADFLDAQYARDLREWSDREYKRIVFAKLDAIAHTMRSSDDPDRLIAYIDTDIVLFSDPTPHVLDRFAPDVQVVHQCDEQDLCSNADECPYLCSGCIAFRNDPKLLECLAYSDTDIDHFPSDQHFLRASFRKAGVRRRSLDKILFPNGASYIRHFEALGEACLLHFNYMVGDEKKARMQVMRLWYLDEG